MHFINNQQQQAIDKFKMLGVLVHFEPSEEDRQKYCRQGIWLWDCGDMNQHGDKKRFWEKHIPSDLIHPYKLNGGAILAAMEHDPSRRSQYLEQAVGSIVLKGMRDLFLEAHFPCGLAGLVGVNPHEQLELLSRSKRWFSEQLTRLNHDKELLRVLMGRIVYSKEVPQAAWEKALQTDFSVVTVNPIVHTCKQVDNVPKWSTYFMKHQLLLTHRQELNVFMDEISHPGLRGAEFEQLSLHI